MADDKKPQAAEAAGAPETPGDDGGRHQRGGISRVLPWALAVIAIALAVYAFIERREAAETAGRLEAALTESRQAASQAEEALAVLESKVESEADLTARIAALESNAEQTEADLNKLNQQRGALEEQVGALESELAAARKQAEDALVERDAALEAARIAEELAVEARAEAETIGQRLDDTRGAIESRSEILKSVTERLTALRAEEAEARAVLAALQQEAAEAAAEAAAASEKLQALEAEMEAARTGGTSQ